MANTLRLIRPSQIFDSLMDDFYGTTGSIARNFIPDVQMDISEDESNVHVTVKTSLPKDQIDIEITDGQTLTVSGQSKEEKEEEDKKRKYYVREIREESFSRTVTLPTKVNAENASATTKDGKLHITLPKIPEVQPKKISISAV